MRVTDQAATSQFRLDGVDTIYRELRSDWPAAADKESESRTGRVIAGIIRDQLQGSDCTVRPEHLEDEDRNGEDGRLLITRSGRVRTVVVQITTIARDWHQLEKDAEVHGPVITMDLVDWIEKAIGRKRHTQLPGAILALDAHYCVTFDTAKLISAYRSRYGDPAIATAFRSIWIVGPTAAYSDLLGGSESPIEETP